MRVVIEKAKARIGTWTGSLETNPFRVNENKIHTKHGTPSLIDDIKTHRAAPMFKRSKMSRFARSSLCYRSTRARCVGLHFIYVGMEYLVHKANRGRFVRILIR